MESKYGFPDLTHFGSVHEPGEQLQPIERVESGRCVEMSPIRFGGGLYERQCYLDDSATAQDVLRGRALDTCKNRRKRELLCPSR